MNPTKTGTLIASCRKANHLTQQQLADKLGVTNKAVSKWETGQGLPDVSLLPELSKNLGVSMDELLSGEQAEVNKQAATDKPTVINKQATTDKQAQKIEQPDNIERANKYIGYFKSIAIFPALFAFIGLVIPYFISKEADLSTGLLFGCWMEFCSALIFFIVYGVLNSASTTSLSTVRNHYLMFYIPAWCLVPILLLVTIV